MHLSGKKLRNMIGIKMSFTLIVAAVRTITKNMPVKGV